MLLPAGEGPCDAAKFTPEVCAAACYQGMKAQADASGGTILVGSENGAECFCDVMPATMPDWTGKAWDPTRPLTPSPGKCVSVCTGEKTPLSDGLPPGDSGCGAGWILDVYTLDCGSDWGWAFIAFAVRARQPTNQSLRRTIAFHPRLKISDTGLCRSPRRAGWWRGRVYRWIRCLQPQDKGTPT